MKMTTRFILSFMTLAGITLSFQSTAHAQEPQELPAVAAPVASEIASDNEEMARLRPYLDAKSTARIQPALTPQITSPFPLKVFISMGLDLKMRDKFVKWAADWQKKDAKKYGAIELVEEAGEADIILVRYTLMNRVVTTESQTQSEIRQVPYNKKKVEIVGTTSTESQVPVFAYIVERRPTSYRVLTAYQDMTSLGSGGSIGEPLWDDFKKLLRQKADAEKTQSTQKPKP